MKKTVSLFLTLCLLLAALPFAALPASAVTPAKPCGVSTTWRFNADDGTLTVSGTGEMTDYQFDSLAPWFGLDITSVVIEEGVTSVGSYSFIETEALTSVSFPNSLKKIGEYAFSNCSILEEISFAEGLESIDEGAFYECACVPFIALPDSLTYIGTDAFYGTDFYDNPDNWQDSALYSQKILLAVYADFEGEYTVKGGTKYIAPMAFIECEGLTKVNIPESVEIIGDLAFAGCTALENIPFPASLKSIDTSAVIDCGFYNNRVNWENGFLYSGTVLLATSDEVFEDFSIKDGTTVIASNIHVTASEDKITDLVIPASVTHIGDNSFAGNELLESITVDAANTVYQSVDNCLIEKQSKTLILGCQNSIIPADGSVTKIGESAFAFCSGLTEFIIPESITSIGEDAFVYCSQLTDITLPQGLTHIGDRAFAFCSGLTELTLPASLKKINDSAFLFCAGLTDLVIPNGICTIGSRAFFSCVGLETISIPNSVTEILSSGLMHCPALTGISVSSENPYYHVTSNCLIETETKTLILGCINSTIPADGSVTVIGDSAFMAMQELTHITIPSTIEVIGANAFSSCANLNNVVIPSSVKILGDSAFGYCDSLNDITIPDSVEEIGLLAVTATLEFNGIHCHKGSVAEAFALENELPVIYLPDTETLKKVNGEWLYYRNDVPRADTTLVKYNGTWFYVKNGKVDWNSDTLCKYKGVWFHVNGGSVKFGEAPTLCKYQNTWFYVKNGQVDWYADTLCKYKGVWFHVNGGSVKFGEAPTLCKYQNTWFYVKNGQVDWKSTTQVKYNGVWFRVKGGTVVW